MLSITIALFVLLAPFAPTCGSVQAPLGGNDLLVDLGYQLNLGQRVVVRDFLCELYSWP